jgi:hypothetical protein
MKTINKTYICLFLSLFLLSCSKWIDIKPTDRLDENQVFSNKEGYLKALNGIYVEMTHKNLYGENMTTGAIDVLAQYYYLKSSVHSFYNISTFVYGDANVKTTFDDTWRKAYELIANCNVIISKCGDAPTQKLPEPYFGIIKGEALALRAMLHLDMLRLFGPIYTDANKTRSAIPYVDKVGYEVSPLLNSEQVMQRVIADLKTALSLLENTDPVRTEGVRNGANTTGPNDLYYRQYRLNYYAAKALLARAYLWQANKADALVQAEELLNEVQRPDKNIFPYVTFASATSADKPDRMFSTEVMFSLWDIKRVEMYDRLFNVNLNENTKLSFSGGDVNTARVSSIYDDDNDYRRRIWQSASSGTITATTNMKYADVVDGPGRYMIPLIRLSEVLLIAAECHPDLTAATAYFNKLRTARNSVSRTAATAAELKLRIGEESRREMLGEGQQFFFYKRNSYQSVPNHATPSISPEKTMVLNNYTVPLPDSETSQRN